MSNIKLQALKSILEKQTVKYEHYIELGNQQRFQLVNHNIEELNMVNLEIDHCTQEIQDLENQRILLFGQIEEKEGRSFTKVQELCDYYDCVDCSPLLESLASLKEVLAKVIKLNGVNKNLIQSSREYIRSSMAIVTGYLPTDNTQKFKTYGDSGRFQSKATQRIQLMNREV